jgi:hypothetical protein
MSDAEYSETLRCGCPGPETVAPSLNPRANANASREGIALAMRSMQSRIDARAMSASVERCAAVEFECTRSFDGRLDRRSYD